MKWMNETEVKWMNETKMNEWNWNEWMKLKIKLKSNEWNEMKNESTHLNTYLIEILSRKILWSTHFGKTFVEVFMKNLKKKKNSLCCKIFYLKLRTISFWRGEVCWGAHDPTWLFINIFIYKFTKKRLGESQGGFSPI